MNFWDIGGQRSIRSFWKSYYEGTDAIVWVIDKSAPQRIEECLEELKKLLSESMINGIILLIVLNKIDIEGNYKIEKIIIESTIRKVIGNKCKWIVWECSAKKSIETLNSLNWLISELKNKTIS